jgi:hypothetical protein
MDFFNPDDIDHHFYEIDLSKEEKAEIVPKLRSSSPISGDASLHAWDEIHGTIYRVYGALGNSDITEDNLIVRLEPHDQHSGR